MKILIGTTNPSKVKRFIDMLEEYDVTFVSLKDLNITAEPQEYGKSSEENAIIKAKFYSQYYDYVICNDSGLFFDELPLDDKRQPGIHIRTPYGKRLDDEEMITYYTNLISTLSGKVLAYYIDTIAIACNGRIASYTEPIESSKASAFYMVDKPSPLRHIGWPLDSISLNIQTNDYFVQKGSDKYDNKKKESIYRNHLINFFVSEFKLNKKDKG